MQSSYETIVVNTRGLPRRRTLLGRQYLVVDATILREGVLNGSRGPLYYPPDEIAANPGIWNAIHIVAWHPKDKDGKPTLARSPEVLEEYGLGLLFNDAYDHATRTRNVEAWFDEARTANFDRRLKDEHKVLPRLRAGVPIELSTGLFTDNVPGAGTFNSPGGTPKGYTHTARNYRPDHLAALPDQPGACSVLDGCGFNVNAASPGGRVDWTKVGDELAGKGLMPGYGQIFLNDEDEWPGDRVWYVGGDGDEAGFSKIVEDTLKAAGAKEVTYEAESFPPKDQSWVQVYPKRRAWVTSETSVTPEGEEATDNAGKKPKGAGANCGIGSGGFQPGNDCAAGGTAATGGVHDNPKVGDRVRDFGGEGVVTKVITTGPPGKRGYVVRHESGHEEFLGLALLGPGSVVRPGSVHPPTQKEKYGTAPPRDKPTGPVTKEGVTHVRSKWAISHTLHDDNAPVPPTKVAASLKKLAVVSYPATFDNGIVGASIGNHGNGHDAKNSVAVDLPVAKLRRKLEADGWKKTHVHNLESASGGVNHQEGLVKGDKVMTLVDYGYGTTTVRVSVKNPKTHNTIGGLLDNANPQGCNQHTGAGCSTAAHTGYDSSAARLNAAAAASRANLASGHASSMSTDPGAFDAAEKARKLGARALAGHGAAHGQKGGGSQHAGAAADAHTVANTKHLIAAAKLGPDNPAGAAHRTAAELHGLAAHRFRHSAHTLKMVGNMGTDDTSLLGRLIASVWNSVGGKVGNEHPTENAWSAAARAAAVRARRLSEEANQHTLTVRGGTPGLNVPTHATSAEHTDDHQRAAKAHDQMASFHAGFHGAADATAAAKHKEAAEAHREAVSHKRRTHNAKRQPSAGLDMTPAKACKILKDGEANGTPLTEKQLGMFGALCGKMTKNAVGEDEWTDGANFDWQLYLVENGHAVGDVLELDVLLSNAPPAGDPTDPDDYTGHQTEYPKNCPLCGYEMKDGKCTNCAYKDAVTNEEDADLLDNAYVGRDEGMKVVGPPADGKCPVCGVTMKDGKCPECGYDAMNHMPSTARPGKTATGNEEVTNSEDPDMATKTENVKYLVTNCECWKNKEAALNAMSEAELDSWRKYHEKARKNEAVVNSLPDLGLTVNSAGQVEKSWEGTVNFKDPNVQDGVCKELFKMTANQSTVLVGFAKRMEEKERFNLVRRLTANIKDPKAQEARSKQLLQLDTEALQERVRDLELNQAENPVVPAPTGNAEDDQYQRFVQSYFSSGGREGAQGGPVPVGNRGVTDKDDAPDVEGDPRPMPVMNYDDVSPTGVKLRKQRAG